MSRRTSTRVVVVVGLVVALLVAGVASYYASAHPDGLERVAEDVGFSEAAEDSPAAGSPLADYRTEGVDDDRLSGGIAGVAGTLLVLVLAGGLALLLRRRPPTASEAGPGPTHDGQHDGQHDGRPDRQPDRAG